jgi:prepilin-type N-terminal cleavage/methylation domain-containing protein
VRVSAVAGRRPGHAAPSSQAGFSLIEILITVALAGTVVLGLVAGLLTVSRVRTSTEERQVVDQALGNLAEGVKSLEYEPCSPPSSPDAADYESAYDAEPANWSPRAGMVAEITDVEYWDVGARRFVASCPGSDRGAQQLTLRVEWRDRVATTQIVVGSR